MFLTPTGVRKKIAGRAKIFARVDEDQLNIDADSVGETDRCEVGAASLINDMTLPLAVAPAVQGKIAKVKITSALGVAE